MEESRFSQIAEEEWERMPERFRALVRNVALLIEDKPDEGTRKEEGLVGEETLLGIYKGVPNTVRGSEYGVGMTLPDTITLYRLPILKVAEEEDGDVRRVIRETLWHEVGHYFGLEEDPINRREEEGTNRFGS